MGNRATTLALALGAAVTAGTMASAQALPAEFPPADYTGTQYVDSNGCAFVRAGMSGAVNWVPRIDRARNQLCNFQPTFAQAPEPEPAAPAEAAPVVTPRTAPVVAAAPAPRAAPAAPRAAPVVRAPAPVVATPAPRPAPVVAPAPARITLAQACDGRFGVQPGFVSAQTGQPIDCGPDPRASVRGPVPAAAPVNAPLRMTLAEACSRVAAGEILVTPAGNPISCPQTAARVVAQAPVATLGCSVPQLAAEQRLPVRCGPQAASPSGLTATLPSAGRSQVVARAATSPATTRVAPKPLFGTSVPRSNPVGLVGAPITVPRGYAEVWDDGRLNPHRGLPAAQARVSTRTVAPQATPVPRATAAPAVRGHRYVQVGSFADPANASRLIARLQAAGLPAASGRSGGLKVVAAGPFASAADLSRALQIVRGMGFSDAYTRG